MCGICGAVNVSLVQNNLTNFIKQSLVVNSLRGTDGSGLLIINKEKEIFLFKKPLSGPDFVQLAIALTMVGASNPRFVVTHNRAGTAGNYNAMAHTHPVEYEHIILVHNGTLTSYYNLNVNTVSHDSSAIAESIAKHGAKATLEKLNGSYALVWYDIKEETLNMARNDDRPLFLANVKENKGMLFASEAGMLSWLAARNSLKLNSIFTLKENTWLKIPFDSKNKHETTKYSPYKPPVIHQPAGGTQYTTINEGQEFMARYVGEGVFGNNDRFHKFTHKNDYVYGWITPLTEENKTEYKQGMYYKLRATEPRLFPYDGTNKACVVLEESPIQVPVIGAVTHLPASSHEIESLKSHYKDESEVIFEMHTLTQAKDNYHWDIVGATADSAEATVKGFHCHEDQVGAQEDYFIAKVRTCIRNPKTEEVYILIYPETIKGYTFTEAHHSPIECGWCTVQLTEYEQKHNHCPELGNSAYLCDTCMNSYRPRAAEAAQGEQDL